MLLLFTHIRYCLVLPITYQYLALLFVPMRPDYVPERPPPLIYRIVMLLIIAIVISCCYYIQVSINVLIDS